MSGDGYQVSDAELRTHANTVRGIAGDVGQAASAAQQVSMGTEAYGLICGPLFVPIVQAVSAPGLTALQSGQQALNSVADTLGDTATGYSDTERTNRGHFTDISPDLR